MSEAAQSIYAGRRVFLTGHTGFKGSWLSLWLRRLGARVTGFALPPPTDPSLFELANVEAVLEHHVVGDIREPEPLAAAMSAAAPDIVFHLAAQPLVRRSYEEPRDTFATNVMGTVHVLEAVRALRRPCAVVVVTSDKCYENREQVWGYRECDPMGGHDPYSASKGATELVVSSWRNSFFAPAEAGRHGVRLASVRAGNVIGGGDWARDRIIVDAVAALCAGRPVGVRNPYATRPWQHVLEPLGGYLALGARLLDTDLGRAVSCCEAWNFGPPASSVWPVGRLVERFVEAWGSGSWTDLSDPAAPHEARLLALNCDKAFHRLGWLPRWEVGRALEATAHWYRAWRDGHDVRALSLGQIAEYEQTRTV